MKTAVAAVAFSLLFFACGEVEHIPVNLGSVSDAGADLSCQPEIRYEAVEVPVPVYVYLESDAGYNDCHKKCKDEDRDD